MRLTITAWLANDIYPALGTLPSGQVLAKDVRDLLETTRNTPVKASGVLSTVERIYKYTALKLRVTILDVVEVCTAHQECNAVRAAHNQANTSRSAVKRCSGAPIGLTRSSKVPT
ncbi:MAG: hypothetical protein IPN53_01005 [Comamonadaceae bacterium]|nr:hypothetical protein [Comamonadaceae bacterium]